MSQINESNLKGGRGKGKREAMELPYARSLNYSHSSGLRHWATGCKVRNEDDGDLR